MPSDKIIQKKVMLLRKKEIKGYFQQRMQLWIDNEPFRKLMFDPRIGKIAD